jgi:hypothetical protein
VSLAARGSAVKDANSDHVMMAATGHDWSESTKVAPVYFSLHGLPARGSRHRHR